MRGRSRQASDRCTTRLERSVLAIAPTAVLRDSSGRSWQSRRPLYYATRAVGLGNRADRQLLDQPSLTSNRSLRDQPYHTSDRSYHDRFISRTSLARVDRASWLTHDNKVTHSLEDLGPPPRYL